MPTMNQIQAEIAAVMQATDDQKAQQIVEAFKPLAQMAKPKPNPIRDAHAFMVQRLAALIPPKLYADNDPEDFEATTEYLLDVARIVDEMILSVGREVKSSASVNINLDVFTDCLRDQLEGNATFEISREAENIREERAA